MKIETNQKKFVTSFRDLCAVYGEKAKHGDTDGGGLKITTLEPKDERDAPY